MCNIFFLTFGLYGKKCRILGGKARQVCQSCILPKRKFIFRKKTPRKNLVFHIVSGLRWEIFLIRHDLFCSLLIRLRFPILELNFEIFSTNFEFFHQFWDLSMNFVPYLAQKFRHSRQKCILRVQTKIWGKTRFRLESVTVFKNIWTFHKNSSDFLWNSWARSSELHSTCTRARFEKITFVSNKYVSFIIMGLTVGRKKLWLPTMFCPHCFQNIILSLQIINWIFWTIFILLSFLRSDQELLRFFMQKFWHVCWSCISRP